MIKVLVALALLGWLPVGLAQDVNPAAAAPEERPLALDLQETVAHIPVTVKDMYGRQETRNIPITIYRPMGEGPWPLVVFNHGRATADKRSQQGRYRPEALARYLVDKGFVVMVPMRVGYAETYGDFDPESNGECSHQTVEPMSLAASDQVLATVDFARSLRYVDATHWIVGGQSVGGLTAIATVGRNPPGLLGGFNFAGGTGGDPERRPGRPCSPNALTRYWASLATHAKVPMLWFYWQNDKYWGPDIPREWHQAWTQNGAQAELHQFAPVGADGHLGLTQDDEHWLPVLDHWLRGLGFQRDAMVARPAPTSYAALDDASQVPLSAKNRGQYAKFLAMPLPRALAVSTQGGCGVASGSYAWGKALGNCRRYGQVCTLYAVDQDVVYVAPQTAKAER